MSEKSNPAGDAPGAASETPYHEQVEEYGGGHIQARHGHVNIWLMVVYFVLLVWALYYGFKYWGGLGPGLDY
jgi:hypothetical protein